MKQSMPETAVLELTARFCHVIDAASQEVIRLLKAQRNSIGCSGDLGVVMAIHCLEM